MKLYEIMQGSESKTKISPPKLSLYLTPYFREKRVSTSIITIMIFLAWRETSLSFIAAAFSFTSDLAYVFFSLKPETTDVS